MDVSGCIFLPSPSQIVLGVSFDARSSSICVIHGVIAAAARDPHLFSLATTVLIFYYGYPYPSMLFYRFLFLAIARCLQIVCCDRSKLGKAAPAAAAAAAGSTTFPPALAQKLQDALGSAQRVEQLSKRTELFARGGISAMDYWSTLKTVSCLVFRVVSCDCFPCSCGSLWRWESGRCVGSRQGSALCLRLI